MAEPLLTAGEVAEVLGVSERYVWRLGRDGELPRVLVGRRVRYDPADVEEFIQARKQHGRGTMARLEQPRPSLGRRRAATSARRRFR